MDQDYMPIVAHHHCTDAKASFIGFYCEKSKVKLWRTCDPHTTQLCVTIMNWCLPCYWVTRYQLMSLRDHHLIPHTETCFVIQTHLFFVKINIEKVVVMSCICFIKHQNRTLTNCTLCLSPLRHWHASYMLTTPFTNPDPVISQMNH